mmetsp:Transcript_2261/g.6820  ORF Transcript_2261/g.6820 Transcript_2261/m.6820 type:complete len:205 (+) Transcript_2261:507-1121(+)
MCVLGGGGGALSRLEAARSLGRVEVRNVAAALVRPHQLALAPARGLSGRGGVRSPREGAACAQHTDMALAPATAPAELDHRVSLHDPRGGGELHAEPRVLLLGQRLAAARRREGRLRDGVAPQPRALPEGATAVDGALRLRAFRLRALWLAAEADRCGRGRHSVDGAGAGGARRIVRRLLVCRVVCCSEERRLEARLECLQLIE